MAHFDRLVFSTADHMNNICGDPVPGSSKRVKIVYKHKDEEHTLLIAGRKVSEYSFSS
jgi:hypothetical protein